MVLNPEIKITILGSGTCVPSLQRSSSAVFVEIADQKILMDIGPGTMRRLLETGNRIYDITHIVLSHFHPDHSAELVPFLFANKYPHASQRKIPLKLIGAETFKGFFNALKSIYGHWIELPPGMLQIYELSKNHRDRLDFGQFSITSIPVNHRPESIGVRIQGQTEKSVVYSGDTGFSENLISLAHQTDIFICESAVADENQTAGHLTPSLAGEIARKAQAAHLVLTHFYPECEKIDIEKQCRNTYNGKLSLARDLMEFSLP